MRVLCLVGQRTLPYPDHIHVLHLFAALPSHFVRDGYDTCLCTSRIEKNVSRRGVTIARRGGVINQPQQSSGSSPVQWRLLPKRAFGAGVGLSDCPLADQNFVPRR